GGLVAAILGCVIVDHHQHAFVDILGGEEEAVVVGPHGSLVFAEVAGDRGDTAVAIGATGGRDRGIDVDLVAPGKGRAPAVVVEGAGEVVHVGGTIAFRTVMRVVEVQLMLVAPKAAVLGTIDRQIVVDAGNDRLAVATLDQRWRQGSRRRVEVGVAAGVGPYRGWLQEWGAAVIGAEEVLPRRHLRHGDDV